MHVTALLEYFDCLVPLANNYLAYHLIYNSLNRIGDVNTARKILQIVHVVEPHPLIHIRILMNKICLYMS